MKKKYNSLSLAAMWLCGFAVALLCCVLLLNARFGGREALSSAIKYAQVYNILDEQYVGELDMEDAADYACYAMVAATGDHWSRYMTAEEYESYKLFQQNSYQGIGVTVQTQEGQEYALVAELVEDSPAQSAGVEIGDYLLSIDGQDLKSMTASEIKALISQRQGKSFELVVLRGEEEHTLTVESGVIRSNPVEYEMLEDNVGYIRIKNFEERAGEGIIGAVDDLKEQGAQSIVFDVRCNPGGLLSELTKALDHLLPEGEMFISADEDGNENVMRSDAEFVDLPFAVLMDENTYSAAEFFAAALSEYDRAVLVGQATTGKSRSQITIPLADGSAVHLSVNRYLTPKRVDLSEAGGLTPDVPTELSDELLPYLAAGELSHEEDSQLAAALTALSEK